MRSFPSCSLFTTGEQDNFGDNKTSIQFNAAYPTSYQDVTIQLLFRGDVFRLHNLLSMNSFLEGVLQLAYASLCILLSHGNGEKIQRLGEWIPEEAITTCMGAPTRVDWQ